MGLIFYSNTSALHPADKYIPYLDDYNIRKDIPALPFSKLQITTGKPFNNKYIDDPVTIGEHIRNHRLKLGLWQKDLAKKFGVTEDCITLWENNHSAPSVGLMPKVISFLGYNPIQMDTSTLGAKLKAFRIKKGLSHKKMAQLIGADPSSVSRWERNIDMPLKRHLDRIREMLLLIKQSPG